MSAFESVTRRLGLPRLDFNIDEHQRGKIMRASVLPSVILMAQLVMLLLELYYSNSELSFAPGFGSGAPEIWQRLYALAANIQFIQVVSLAGLFAAGIFNWNRAEGSWVFAIAVCLSAVSLVLGGGAAILELFTQDPDFLSDIRIFTWQRLASTCGLLAVGYFFLAYRGLASQGQAKRRRRVIRRPPSSGLASLDD